MPEFVMPSLGADMTEGTLLHWLVEPGGVVHAGDVVAEVDTAKAAIEVECFDDGVIGEILVPEGVTVPVGTPLATIESSAPAVKPVAVPTSKPVAAEEHHGVAPDDSVTGTHSPATHLPGADGSDLRRATPLVRRLAAEAGIDLAAVHGTGPGGRIVRSDVDHLVAERDSLPRPPMPGPAHVRSNGARGPRASGYARRLATELGVDLATIVGSGPGGAMRAGDVRAATIGSGSARSSTAQESTEVPIVSPEVPPGNAPESGTERELPPRDRIAMRRTIAAAMTKSKQTVPHYYLSSTIDMEAALHWLREVNRQAAVSERMLPAALLLTATARAALAVPELNGHWIDDEFRPASAVHLGVVVSLRGGGIIVPTIPDAGTLAPPAMMSALRGVAERTRTLRLRSGDTAPATITVTNLGDLGADSVFGVIAAPQVAIVGFGAISERPCAVDGLLGVRAQVTATLSADHRASDGAVGARFLHVLSDLLHHPEEL